MVQEARPWKSSEQAVPIAVHDTDRWAGRVFYYDVLALCVLLLGALALGLDVYSAGFARAVPSAGASVSFAPLARLGVELALCIVAFTWVAGRLLGASYRRLPKKA